MDSGIGAILRDARNRRKVDLSEVEAATQIRIRYLRAIENEQWDVLPGGVYTRGFIRTYAAFLGLDGEKLAEDFRRSGAPAATGLPGPIQPRPRSAPRQGLPRVPARVWAALISAGLIAVVVIVGLSGGGEDTPTRTGAPSTNSAANKASAGRPQAPQAKSGVSVRLAATAEVWVCMLDAGGRRLVNGQILESGATEGPFHSDSFTVSFGNGEVSMRIDGKQADIPETSSPIGYAIDESGQLTELSDAERPTCI